MNDPSEAILTEEAEHKPEREPWVDIRDVCAFCGLGLVAGGLYMVWLPGALIVPGAALFWMAVRR